VQRGGDIHGVGEKKEKLTAGKSTARLPEAARPQVSLLQAIA
jgi:hypothetical protein